MKKEPRYVVAGSKAWNRRVFDKVICRYPGEWHLVSAPEDLTLEILEKIKPAYIFFLHWSWKVPPQVISNYKCICFHMTDVPYGRGGSPLQNLISRGHRQTKMTALLMVDEFDAGPVYLREPLCLEGNAEEIFIRATYLCAEMIRRILEEDLRPVLQTGEPVLFKRRKPEQSRIEKQGSLRALHDFIRMLDAEGYPKAFLEYEGFRYEFSRAALYDGRIKADVVITSIKERD